VSCFEQILGDAAQETMGEETATAFMAAYGARIAGWQDRIDPVRPIDEMSKPTR
jgi:hypothetical protein